MAAAEDPTLIGSFDLAGFLAQEQRRNVPDHLRDTKIYAKLGQNEIIQARPTSVHFNGFEVGKIHAKTMKIINMSGDRQRMHIIPPTSKNFRIKYLKEDTLIPGIHLEVTVLFRGSQYQYYNDCIRIHSKASENLVVPLYAYPVINIEAFPSNLHFSPTPIGQRKSKTIPLKSNFNVDFEFQVSLLQRNPAFSVEPMSGFIRGGEQTDLVISFTPQEYSTLQMQFQVLISEFNAKPLVCSVTGTSIPGLRMERIEKEHLKISDEKVISDGVIDPRALSPLNRSRNRKSEIKKLSNIANGSATKDIFHEGIRFPANLSNQAAVAQVLMQKTGKLRVKDIREAVKDQERQLETNRQMKEAVFEHLVSRKVAEEERSQLRWCTQLGDDCLSNIERDKILEDRKKFHVEYQIHRGDPQLHEEFDRSTTFMSLTRTQRKAEEHASDSPTFDTHVNDVWSKRHTVLHRFVQAARKVLIRERVNGHLQSLGNYMNDWRKGRFSTDHKRNWEELDSEQQITSQLSVSIDPAKVKFFYFPDFEDQNLKDDMAADALGAVKTSQTNVTIAEHVPFHRLKVPSQYKVLGYKTHAVPSSIYVPKGLSRSLRTGSEGLQSEVDAPVEDQLDKHALIENIESLSDKISTNQSVQHEVFADDSGLEEFQLVAPSVLLKKTQYHPLHIFNSEPGVLLYSPQLRNSEADEKNKLLPVPTGTDDRSTIKLHKEDVIQGAMTWKRFPIQGLISVNSFPTLSNVYVPRWSDPFSLDMMPTNIPQLLMQLPDDDAPTEEENIDPESSNLVPTMEMVRAQFQIPRTSQSNSSEDSELFATAGRLPPTNNPIGKTGPISRAMKAKELESHIRDKRNKLGQRIHVNTENLQHYLNQELKENDKSHNY